MQEQLCRQPDIRLQIQNGTTLCPSKDYPYMMFKVGMLFVRVGNFSKVWKFMEGIQYLSAEKRISQTIQGQLFAFLYENPELHEQANRIVDMLIDNKPISIFIQIQKLQHRKEMNAQHLHQNKPSGDQGHKQSSEPPTSVPPGPSSHLPPPAHSPSPVPSESPLHMYTEQYFQRLARQNEQSQALARQLQQQQQLLAKPKPEDTQVLCQICYVGLYDQQFHPLEQCSHIFHKNCLAEYFKAKISENQFPLTCPDDECTCEMKNAEIRGILDDGIYDKYQKSTLKMYADTHGDSISWCPTADCEYMFFYQKDDDCRFECLQCHKQYCLNCRVQWHKEMTCKQYKVSSTHSADDQAFLKFAKGKKFKQCPKCKFWVEKTDGCDHMRCKCKFQFCYKCGGVYMKCECVEKAKQQADRQRENAERRKAAMAERKKAALEDKAAGRRSSRKK